MDSQPFIGVLAMQGAFREHVAALAAIGVAAREVRTASELDEVDALVLPGGESTAIRKQLVRSGLYDALRERLAGGMPALGTCAGMIVLADAPEDGAPSCYGLLDVDVERNGFGRQAASFEGEVEYEPRPATAGGHVERGVFIRAPRITRVGAGVEVIARLAVGTGGGEPVAVRQGALLGCAYHPELTTDRSLHRMLVQACVDSSKEGLVGRAQ